MSVERLIRETRQKHNISQRTLARRARTSQAYISKVEQGEVAPGLDKLQKLFHAMGEQLALTIEPIAASNQTDYDRRQCIAMNAVDCVKQAAELSYVSTVIATAKEVE